MDLPTPQPGTPGARRRVPSNGDAEATAESLPRLDAQALAGLERIGGERLVRRLVELFETLVPERLAALGAAVQGGDSATVQREAHALKSNAGNLGAMRMWQLSLELELQAGTGSLTEAESLVRGLTEEFRHVATRLRGRIDERAA